MRIAYGLWRAAWADFHPRLERLIEARSARRVCEVGAGANPALARDYVAEHRLEYTLVDVSRDELDKAPDGYARVVADAAAPGFRLDGHYDVVFTKMVAEHVPDPERFHRNILELLVPGGAAFHFFATLYAPPFVVNRIVPEAVAERLLAAIQPGRERHGAQPKFGAYYRWCRGPTRTQLRRFSRLGYDVEEYVGYFGTDYLRNLRAAQWLDDRLAAALVRRPVAWLTSYAHLVLSRPERDPSRFRSSTA